MAGQQRVRDLVRQCSESGVRLDFYCFIKMESGTGGVVAGLVALRRATASVALRRATDGDGLVTGGVK